MNDNDYLRAVLDSQTLKEGGVELTALRKRRDAVETVLREHFEESSPTIRYGGSKAKGTMIKEAYDLDIVCYFDHDDDRAGKTLDDIYNNVRTAVADAYYVEQKPSALRLKDKEHPTDDFHIDVVPGRFTSDEKTDAFLYRSTREGKRLKTNIDIHIVHVKESGVTDAVRLLKLWRVRKQLAIRHFPLELLAVKLLKGRKENTLANQLLHVFEQLRDKADSISIEDPANPNGNDLSELMSAFVRSELKITARASLLSIENDGWEGMFGSLEEEHHEVQGTLSREEQVAGLKTIGASIGNPAKKWYDAT